MVSRGRRGSTSPARSSSLSKQVRCRERRKPRERADLARGAFTIGEDEVAPGERRLISLPMSALANRTRSEEHTSELQSLMRISYAVFCLKKKKQHNNLTHTTTITTTNNY